MSSPSSSSSPTSSSSSSSSSSSASSRSPAAEQPAKKRKKSSTAPRTLTKEELADYIEQGEFKHCRGKDKDANQEDDDGNEENERKGVDALISPFHDDCDEVRRKLKAFLRSDRMTQTAFLKLIGCQNVSFQRFMKLSGPAGGKRNSVYQRSDQFFETLRILEHKPESAKRLRSEEQKQRIKSLFSTFSNSVASMAASSGSAPSEKPKSAEQGPVQAEAPLSSNPQQ